MAGSAARGDADRYSDLDLLMYAEEVPPAEAAAAAQLELGAGPAVVLLPHGPHGFLDQFPLGGVQCQVGVIPVADVDDELDGLLVDHEGLETPAGKIATGLLEGIPLHGDARRSRDGATGSPTIHRGSARRWCGTGGGSSRSGTTSRRSRHGIRGSGGRRSS